MKTQLMQMLMGLLLGVFAGQQAQAFYNPSTGRWLSRDPIHEQGARRGMEFEIKRAAMINRVIMGEFDNGLSEVLRSESQGSLHVLSKQIQSMRDLVVNELAQLDSFVLMEMQTRGDFASWWFARDLADTMPDYEGAVEDSYGFAGNSPISRVDKLGLVCLYRCGPVKPKRTPGIFGRVYCDYVKCSLMLEACICSKCPKTTSVLGFSPVCLPLFGIPIPVCFCPGTLPLRLCP